jgi:hypothetical protein
MEMNIVPIIITAKRYSKIKANKKKIKFNSIIIHNFSKVISNAAVLKNPIAWICAIGAHSTQSLNYFFPQFVPTGCKSAIVCEKKILPEGFSFIKSILPPTVRIKINVFN